MLGHVAEVSQQDGLPDAPKPDKYHGLYGHSRPKALKHDVSLRNNLVATGKLWRPIARPGRVWIGDWVH